MKLHPFSQKSRTPTVAKEFQIGLYNPAEADLELFCNSWSAGFLGERLYVAEKDCPATRVTGPGRRLPPRHPHRHELRTATARSDIRGLTRPR